MSCACWAAAAAAQRTEARRPCRRHRDPGAARHGPRPAASVCASPAEVALGTLPGTAGSCFTGKSRGLSHLVSVGSPLWDVCKGRYQEITAVALSLLPSRRSYLWFWVGFLTSWNFLFINWIIWKGGDRNGAGTERYRV